MSRKDYKYGISRTSILVYGLSSTRKPTEERTALIGSVVKIEGTLGNGNVIVRFLDKTSLQFEESSFFGKQMDFIAIAERLWPLLVAMPSPMDRISVAANADLCDTLIAIQINSSIDVLYSKVIYPAVVKYIGPVEAMGAGYYLGLEIVSRIQITKCDGSYAGKSYFSALPGTALFVSIDKIRPVATFLASITRKHHLTHSLDVQDVETRPSALTRDARSVEIYDKPKHAKNDTDMDLIELIGGSWPGVIENKVVNSIEPVKAYSARPATVIENKVANSTEGSVKVVRNKSLNPVSHLISGRKITRTAPKNEVVNANTVNAKAVSVNSESDVRTEVSDTATSTTTTYDTPAVDDIPVLTLGTLVQVVTDISEPLYGVVRHLAGEVAGVELEEDHEHLPLVLTDGTHNGTRYFSCANGRALFVPVRQCQRDKRFDDGKAMSVDSSSKMFGQRDSPIVSGSVAPLCMPTEDDVLAVCGKYRGIQGHHNSCYLDATLFAMFTYTAVFDSLLFRPRTPNDISQYEEVQRVLREEIVNPLRQNLYVRADRVMKLRTLLEDLSSVSGLTSEEKDPEEFLNSLLAQILKAEPFLKLSSGQEAFHYQLFVEKDEGLALPSVQQLFEQSFLSSDIKLKEVPSCLIIQMPRFGKNFKMYPRILPSQLLDVTDIIENSPRQCTICGSLATSECLQCFNHCSVGLESTAFCSSCLDTAHAHARRTAHAPRPLRVPPDFAIIAEHCPPPRLYMELFAVVCIETSHYVAFVKCGSGHEAPWCFFDSMADRKGEQHGYNIPEMVACPDVSTWLSDDGAVSRHLHETHPQDKQLPEHARRLLCDAYICMYQSPDVMMYR